MHRQFIALQPHHNIGIWFTLKQISFYHYKFRVVIKMDIKTSDGSKIRKRIETEDALFNSRSTIFLAINGIWLSAVSVSSQSSKFQLIIPFLGFIISILWRLCIQQSVAIIDGLNKKHLELAQNDAIEKFIDDNLMRNSDWRPTEIIGKWIPRLFIGLWLALFAYQLYKFLFS